MALSETNIERHQRFGSPSTPHKDAIVFVSRLPPELLAYIFFIFRDIQPTWWLGPCGTRVTGLGWIVVTHVCSGWRSTATGCPALWTKDTFSLGSQWAECILSRSHQVPVEIRYRIGDQSTPPEQDAKLIAEHMIHTCSLIILTENESLSPFLQKLTAPAPVLHTLEFLSPGGIDPERDPTVPDNFLGNNSPCLRNLQVCGVLVPWTSPMLRNLQILDLSVPNLTQSPAHCIPTLSQFLDALEQMPDLETLDVIGVLPSFSPSRDILFPVDRKVALPRIIDLSLGGATLDVALALSRLITPPNSDLTLSCISCNDADHAATLFRMISDRLGTANPILITDLKVTGGDYFEVWGSMTFPSGTSCQLFVSFEHSARSAEVLHQFLVALPQLQISGIDVSDMPMSQSTWQRVFAHESMASVKSVAIDEPRCLRGFTKFLSSQPVTSVPKLRSLKCINTNFLGVRSWLDRLRDVLQRRKEIGMPLQKISMYQCLSVDEDWISRLEGIVPSVIVSDDVPSDDESSDGDFDELSDDELEDSSDDALGRSSGGG